MSTVELRRKAKKWLLIEDKTCAKKSKRKDNRYPLRGSVYRYDSPTDPVAEDDWEALR